ncbi:hypothetical protein DFJ67_1842 [Asanoa ferruginea]|uniref:DUF7910 domain-containing protein n=1 Tax=Asanoa ferruginea TaxID=53367 RepID=A0A3D9ZGA2_9ACTN|nr:hypothetical protein [Asanoa ferruginea]REF95879.1 hypothetical protein DFJ67_1842 [Asanoa ferruginea]GIF50748.1 hypothetical protein Afe04nite_52870 [Asanoa ferruginea]
MRLNRKFAALLAALVATGGAVAIASPAAAAAKPTITGTAVCDEANASFTVNWTVTNDTETAVAIKDVVLAPVAPANTLTGIAAGDILPPASEGPLTATATVHSYGAGRTVLAIRLVGTVTTLYSGVVLLPTCGDPVMPTVNFQSRCDDLLVSVAMPAGGYAAPIDVTGGGPLQTVVVEPGAPARSLALKPTSVSLGILGFTWTASGRWEYPASCLPPSTGVFQLFARSNYRYVHPDNRGWAITEGTDPRSPEARFEFYDAGGGDVAIRSVWKNQFLTYAGDGIALEFRTVSTVGDAQRFRLIANTDGTVSLRAKNGRYVVAEPGQALYPIGTAIGSQEKFSRYADGTGPGAFSALGRFVTAESAGAKPLIANRQAIGHWEYFQVQDLGNGDVALKSLVNGKYVCAESAGKKELIANRTAVGPWETFKLVKNPNGSVSFRAKINGRYVTAESAGKKPLIANRTAIGPWEMFYL